MNASQLTAAYEQYFPVIRAKCARMLNDPQEAQDVAQETFIRLWQSDLADQDRQQVSAWIYRTSTRAAIDRMRQRSRQRQLHEQAALHAYGGPGNAEQVPGEDEASLGARRLLLQLASQTPAQELEVAILSRLDLLTHIQIAEVAACSERTVRRLLQRFDQRVQQLPGEMRL